MTSADNPDPELQRINKGRLIIFLLALPVYFALFMFLPAGTWAWTKGWLFIGVFLGTLVVVGFYLWRAQRLVVQGVYRYVRNPMISGVLFVVLGEAVLAASLPLLVLFALALIVNVVYLPLSEESGLVKRFGDDYRTYKQNVPRWIPRLRPWQADACERKAEPS